MRDQFPRFSPGAAPEDLTGYWAACAAADYDRDGRMDVFGASWSPSEASPLYRNVSDAGNFLNVRIDTRQSGTNRNGIGATVRIYKAGQAGQASALLAAGIIRTGNGYSSGTEAVAHFGLANQKTVDVVVTMPCNGSVYTANKMPANKIVTLPLR